MLRIFALCVLVPTMLLAGQPCAAAITKSAGDLIAFRALYKELVETDTTLSQGDCTAAARKIADRLAGAGYPAEDLHLITAPGHPKEGNLVATLHGKDPRARPILLLAHIDVVEARREDWKRDPFKLSEENGYFYARGAMDDKAMASILVDSLIRFRQSGFRPRGDVKLALTCGEESVAAFNGAKYLAENYRALIDADFAINEGAAGRLDEHGKPVALSIQAGEKIYQDFELETTGPGGHSARPGLTNPIYKLNDALARIRDHRFPVRINSITRAYFAHMGPIFGGETGQAMAAFATDGGNQKAIGTLSGDPTWNSLLRTTCVATTLTAGEAPNALPQRARANVNCRIFPPETPQSVGQELKTAIGDPSVMIALQAPLGAAAPTPLLTPAIIDAVATVAQSLWPGVPVISTFLAATTDGRYLNAAGIPTYGMTGLFIDPDGGGIHGVNERLRVDSLYKGRQFLFAVISKLAGGAR